MVRKTSWQPHSESGITIEFVEANGWQFEVAMAGEDPRMRSTDRLALCLHGFPELHYSWRHQMPMLAELGYGVWAPNMRGYGQTSRPEGIGNYRLHMLVQDVAALIDASEARKVTLIAHDWGAIIAWHFAIRKIRPLTNLVIMNVPHPECGRREIRKWRQLRKSWYIFFFQLPWLPEKLLARGRAAPMIDIFRGSAVNKARFSDDALKPYRRAANERGALTAMLNYYRALLRFSDAGEVGEAKVDVPTLVLWGEQDLAIDIHCLDRTEDYVRDLTVRRFPDASHWVQQDVPEEVNAELRRWLIG
ncbi:MAG: alpha/beta hydrolase [Pontixanthobacter sp.]